MSGSSILIDTNIALYLLNGDQDLAKLLYLKRIHLSFINELELLGCSGKKIQSFIRDCQVTDINSEIKSEVIKIREKYRLKLPDSIILATARFLQVPFLTADLDFERVVDKTLSF